VMTFYRDKVLQVLVPLASILPETISGWVADAALIASVLFFHFFIAQARRAMAPLDGERREYRLDRAEALIDWALPAAFCAAGAALMGPSLLPLLTLPVAVVFEAWRLAGRRSWFKVPAGYYANLLGLALVPALIAALGL
jgi:hypothetical protein